MAPAAMRSAGCVPAEVEGISLTWFQSATASWDRALFRGADEEDAAGSVFGPGSQSFQRAFGEPYVAAAPVGFRTVAGRQARAFQRAQVVGQQVRRHPEFGLQLRRGKVSQGQQVHDAQPRGIGEGRVLGDPRPEDFNWVSIH